MAIFPIGISRILFPMHGKGHRFAVQVVAVIHPDLLHHDTLAVSGAVDDLGRVAAVLIALGHIGRVAACTPAALQQDILVQMAFRIVFGQVFEDRVPSRFCGFRIMIMIKLTVIVFQRYAIW